MTPTVSVIIPAYNEEFYLPATLMALRSAVDALARDRGARTELILVDNESTDQTAEVAVRSGVSVIREVGRGIGRVRNVAVRHSKGSILVFVDADTIVPATLLTRIFDTLASGRCAGGAVSTDYRPRRLLVRWYLQVWAILGYVLHTAQGATQFVTRTAFEALDGYDEQLYMGEDVDFYWRLRALSRRLNQDVVYLRDISVQPSCRRFDQWPLYRTLFWTNPLTVMFFARSSRYWRYWYEYPPR